MKCFYHSADFDGWCSGAIVKYRYPECELYPIDYGDDFPWEEVKSGEVVFMVDFSLQPFQQMVKLAEMAHLFWIDHHISAIRQAEEANANILGARNQRKAACVLTWEHLYFEKPLPLAVKLIGDYDLYDFSDFRALPFQYGLRIAAKDPAFQEHFHIWNLLFEDQTYVDEVIKWGEVCLDYHDQLAKSVLQEWFVVTLDGIDFKAVNAPKQVRPIGDRETNLIYFNKRGDNMWRVNLYAANDFEGDLSEIAKKYGGGGHKKAAGFICTNLPWE